MSKYLEINFGNYKTIINAPFSFFGLKLQISKNFPEIKGNYIILTQNNKEINDNNYKSVLNNTTYNGKLFIKEIVQPKSLSRSTFRMISA